MLVVRSVDSFSGSMGKISAAVYTEVVACVRVNGRSVFDERVHIRDGHQELDFIDGQSFGHSKLIEVAGVVIIYEQSR